MCDSDFDKLANFPPRWRWLEEKHYAFSKAELSRVRPLLPAAAKKAAECCAQWHAPFNQRPSAELFENVATLEHAHESSGTAWLAKLLPTVSVPVVVS